MVSLVICLEGRERHAVVGDRTKPNRLQRTDLQSRRPSSSVQDTDSKPAVALPTATMMTEQTNKLRAKPEMTIAKLEILTANPEITDANLEKNFTATEMTMTARGMVSVIRPMVGTEHAGVATLVHHTSTVTAGEREPMRLPLNKAKACTTKPHTPHTTTSAEADWVSKQLNFYNVGAKGVSDGNRGQNNGANVSLCQ